MKYDCLIVDDEEMLSENTLEYFEMFDIKTAWVADEKSCLDFFRENEALHVVEIVLQYRCDFQYSSLL